MTTGEATRVIKFRVCVCDIFFTILFRLLASNINEESRAYVIKRSLCLFLPTAANHEYVL